MIRQRGSHYEVRVYCGRDPATGQKKHLYGTATSQRAARILEGDLQREAARSTASDADLSHLLDRWLKVARHAPSTRYDVVRRLDRWVRPELGDVAVAKITTELLDQFYLDLEEKLAPATIVRVHGMLRAALGQAVRWKWIDHNPAVGTRLPEVPNPSPVALNDEDVQRLLREAPPDFAMFLRLCAVTGMRRGEACALRRSDIDLKAGVIRKARAISQGEERKTKTGARYGLALGAATADMLRSHLAAMDDRAAEFDITLAPDCFVFSHEPDCSQPWRPDGVTQRLRRLCARLGLPNIRTKDLRDYMITSALERGHSVRSVAGRAGHARASTTLDHYAAWVPASDAALASELDDLLK